jgi:hypothetical protein
MSSMHPAHDVLLVGLPYVPRSPEWHTARSRRKNGIGHECDCARPLNNDALRMATLDSPTRAVCHIVSRTNRPYWMPLYKLGYAVESDRAPVVNRHHRHDSGVQVHMPLQLLSTREVVLSGGNIILIAVESHRSQQQQAFGHTE